MYDDDKKKKKDKSSDSSVKGNELTVGSVKKKRGLISAIGNTDAFQKHLEKKGERILEKKHDGNVESYNVDVSKRNNKLAQKGITSSYRYNF